MVIQSVCRSTSEVSRFLNVVVSSQQVQQKVLAESLHVDPSWLSRCLNGSQNLTLSSFFKLLNVLGVELNLVFNDNCFISPVVPPLNL